MESSTNSARRSEDIALDLLKFIAPHANVGRAGSASTGFGAAERRQDRGPDRPTPRALRPLPRGRGIAHSLRQRSSPCPSLQPHSRRRHRCRRLRPQPSPRLPRARIRAPRRASNSPRSSNRTRLAAPKLAALYDIPAFASIDEALQNGAAPVRRRLRLRPHHPPRRRRRAASQTPASTSSSRSPSPPHSPRPTASSLSPQRNHRILQIGHLERFNPAVTAGRGAHHAPHVLRGPPPLASSPRARSTSTSSST